MTNTTGKTSIGISALTATGIMVLAVFLFWTEDVKKIQGKPFPEKRPAAIKMNKIELPPPPLIKPLPKNKALIKPLTKKSGNLSFLRPAKHTAYKKKVGEKIPARHSLKPAKKRILPVKQRAKGQTQLIRKNRTKGATLNALKPTKRKVFPVKQRLKKKIKPAERRLLPVKQGAKGKTQLIRKNRTKGTTLSALKPTKRQVFPVKQKPKKKTNPFERMTRTAAKSLARETVKRTPNKKLTSSKAFKPVGVREKQHIKSQHSGATGRALLRMLEHGKGPSIEIAWPEYRRKRQELFKALRQCFGMKSAVLNHNNLLFAENHPPGTSWNFNVDKFSGFLRSPAGEPIYKESNTFQRIARHHGLNRWKPVRVFPRPVDAILLGGLEKIVGSNYGNASNIRARYHLGNSGLILTGIHVDSLPVGGTVEIPYPVNQNCNV